MRGVKFIEEKNEAIRLRKQGFSIVEIEKKLHINRSTLFSWIRDVKLDREQLDRLSKHRRDGLLRARVKALVWHNNQKAQRLQLAEIQAAEVFRKMPLSNEAVIELALAMLYWGEGFKNSVETGLGNSDPTMLSVFVTILLKKYRVPIKQIRCELYLRADQSIEEMKSFWSQKLKLPLENFRHVALDKRTKGTKTFESYKGVCSVRCGNVAIQRKLGNISKLFAEYILKRA